MPGARPRIGIVGSGAVGTYFGTRMALAGADVHFLMRSDLEEVRRRNRMAVADPQGEQALSPVAVHGSPGEIGPVDTVIVALKTTSAAESRDLIGPLVGPDTAVVTLQNGLGADEFLADLFGAERIMGGLVFMALNRTGPGEARLFGRGHVSIGEFRGPPVERTRALVELMKDAGLNPQAVDNLLEARWRKLVWNIPFNGLSIALGGITTDRICADPAHAAEVERLMIEVQRAAAAFGFGISDSFLRKQREATPPMGPYRPSSLVDYLAGRAVEVESIWGEPLRRAQAAGVAMPRLAALYGRLTALCAPPGLR